LHPRRDLLVPTVADAVAREAESLTADGAWILRCLTVMPDHMYLFFTLGGRLKLSQAVARLKSKTQVLVRAQGVDWQDNFYDHKVRPEDSVEQIIRYIFLNPFRAGLITQDETWPHFFCRNEDWEWFQGLTDSGQVFPEWLQ
jgi:REP element-mobilizing transposase RayT